MLGTTGAPPTYMKTQGDGKKSVSGPGFITAPTAAGSSVGLSAMAARTPTHRISSGLYDTTNALLMTAGLGRENCFANLLVRVSRRLTRRLVSRYMHADRR